MHAPATASRLRVALVHDFLLDVRGAERVFLEMCELWPDAPIFTAIYDEDGTLTTSSMVDYMIPGAPELPNYTLERTVTPSPTNPLGVKGVGEAGTIGAPQAVINSIIDALEPFGVKHIDMPASPMRVWKAIQNAQGQQSGEREADASLESRGADVQQGGDE